MNAIQNPEQDNRPNWLKAFESVLSFLFGLVIVGAFVFLIYTKG